MIRDARQPAGHGPWHRLRVAFGRIVTSLVNELLMPPIGLLVGRVDFNDLFLSLNGKIYPSVAAPKAAGAATINYGTVRKYNH